MADVEAIEQTPLEDAVQEWTTYELICASARDFADKPAFHYLSEGTADETPITVDYRSLGANMHQCANALARAGAEPGGVIAYLLPNRPETIYVLLGGTALGTVQPINWMLEPAHLKSLIAAGKPSLIVASSEPEIADKLAALDSPPPILWVDQLRAIMEREDGAGLDFEWRAQAEDTALYLHTGGTTGKPKLARLPHRGIAYHCWADAVAKALTHEDVLFAGGPLYHSGGIILDVFSTYGIGATSVILTAMGFRNRAVVRNYWKIAARYGLTMLNGVPTVLGTLVNTASAEPRPKLRPYMGTGSAPLPIEVAKGVARTFGIKPLSTYGATEFTCLISCPPRDGDPKYGSCGLPYPHSRFRISNGAIQVKGPGVIPGYVDAADNVGLFEDGWLNTGDLGRIDEDGYLWITGRAKDVIIRGGHNIDSRVIEETLVAHPAVALAAAVGKPDAYAGELPVAYVQLKPGASATVDEIKAYARDHIPERAATPVEVTILDALPLTSIGKIYKPPLKQDATRRVLSEVLREFAVGVEVTEELRAIIRLRDPAREGEVRAILGRYALAFDINI